MSYKNIICIICIGLTLVLSSCSSADHVIRFNLAQQKTTKPTKVYKGKSHFFLWVMMQKKSYDAQSICSTNGVHTIENYWTLYDSLMGGLTCGIYAPESYAIYCN